MPKPFLGGILHKKINAGLAVSNGNNIDKINLAIELIFTEGKLEAAQILREVLKDERLQMKIHTLLQADDVDEARTIFENEIKPALTSGKGKDK